MSKAYDKVMAGLEDARDYLNGERGGSVVHEIEVPEPDLVAMRGKTGLSQPAFAKSIGVSLGTLKNWEQRRRRPEGPARVLLALIEKRPSIVQEELGRQVVHDVPSFSGQKEVGGRSQIKRRERRARRHSQQGEPVSDNVS